VSTFIVIEVRPSRQSVGEFEQRTGRRISPTIRMGQEGNRRSPTGQAAATQHETISYSSNVKLAAWTAAAVAVTLAVVLLLLPLKGTAPSQQLNAPNAAMSLANHCLQLPGMHGELCSAYSQAVGEDKWAVASAWRQVSPASCRYTATSCLGLTTHIPSKCCRIHVFVCSAGAGLCSM
jgi:hypothetical protein